MATGFVPPGNAGSVTFALVEDLLTMVAAAPPVGKDKGASEPTNHAGHTHEMARRHEHDRRVEAMRSNRGSTPGHTKPDHVTQSKHGAAHYERQGGGEAGE